GASSARNIGWENANAPFVAFLDGDDAWPPTKLEPHLRLMEACPELNLTYSLSVVVDENGQEVVHLGSGPRGRIGFEELLCENFTRNGSAVVVRRSALAAVGGFDESFSAA